MNNATLHQIDDHRIQAHFDHMRPHPPNDGLVRARSSSQCTDNRFQVSGGQNIRASFRFDAGDGDRYDVGAELDVFDWMDLASFVSLTRHALRQGVDEITAKEQPNESEPEQ